MLLIMSLQNNIEILLVEDNLAEALLITRAIKKSTLAANVCHVKDGVEAIDFLFCRNKFVNRKIDSIPPKLILLDLKMPRMDGHEVLKVIKADEKTKTIPVVMLTTSNDDNDVRISYELGVNSYVVKSADLETINATTLDIGQYWLNRNFQ